MNRVHLAAALVLPAVWSACGVAHAQARGPAAAEVLEYGQDIPSGREQRAAAAGQAREQAMEAARKEQEELRDPAFRAGKLAELDTWFRRISGRFRIDGLIEEPAGPFNVVSDKVTGVADCIGVGEGVGVQCFLTATWRIIESGVADIGARPPPSEMLRTFNPTVLVLGLNLDPPGIRAQMVDAESLAHTWVGKLWENTAKAGRVNRALAGRVIQRLEIIAEPHSDVVTIVLHSGAITLTLTMYRDPEARAEKPIKTLKSR